MKTPSNNSYCDFAENKTIEFLPESWGMRWSILAFKVNKNSIIIVDFIVLLQIFNDKYHIIILFNSKIYSILPMFNEDRTLKSMTNVTCN